MEANFLIDRIEHTGPGTRPGLPTAGRFREEHHPERVGVEETMPRGFAHPQLAEGWELRCAPVAPR
jgi:hypothetical protein